MNLLNIYTFYWIAAYCFMLILSLYGYFKLRLRAPVTWTAFLKYVSTLAGSILSLWAIWHLGLYLCGRLTVEEFMHRDLSFLWNTSADTLFALVLSGFLLTVARLFRTRALLYITYSLICFAVIATTVNNFTVELRSGKEFAVSEFPAGEKQAYLESYLTRHEYRNKLLMSGNPSANAWVVNNADNLDIYFTGPAIRTLSKEQLLGVMLHEIGHKYNTFWLTSAITDGRILVTLVLCGWMAFLSLLVICDPLAKRLGIMIDTSKPKRNLKIIKIHAGRLPARLLPVVLLFAVCTLPTVAGINYLERLEEINADAVAKRLLESDGLPSSYLIDGLQALHAKEYGTNEDFHWIYQLCFSDHPATSERITLISQGN